MHDADVGCAGPAAIICMINYGAAGLGASIAVPHFYSGTLTCPLPPDEPPPEALMAISAEQPDLMCPGKKARYDCAAGGIDVRYVSQCACAVVTDQFCVAAFL